LTTPRAFSLGDPRTVERILETAGFVGVAFEEVHEPVYYGPDVDAALELVLQFSTVQEIAASLTAGERGLALARLREVLDAHRTRDGVWFDSRAWIVAARRG
jgi:hypothetical protein